ncbi:hypothetical protein ACHAW6_003649, partial [Cyclotella cf. meneghiniana]
QPTNEDLNQLTKECINAASSISTTNGGCKHGHARMIIPEAEYITFSHNAKRFVITTNPGPYSATVSADAIVFAEHEAEQGDSKLTVVSRISCARPSFILLTRNGLPHSEQNDGGSITELQ